MSVLKRVLVARAAAAVVLSVVVPFGAVVTPAAAQQIRSHGDPSAEQFVQTQADKAIAILNNRNLSAADKKQAFYGFVNQNVDVPRITNFVLGRYRRQITPAQYQQFAEIFRTYADKHLRDPTGRLSRRNDEGDRLGGPCARRRRRLQPDPGRRLQRPAGGELAGAEGR